MTKGRKIALGILVGVPLVCGVGGFAVFQGAFGAAARTRDREVVLARAEGIPVTPDELQRLIAVPSDQNAYPVYEKLSVLMARRDESMAMAAVEGGLWLPSPKAAELAKRAYPKLRNVIALAREETKYPHLAFPLDRDGSGRLPVPNVIGLTGVTRVLLYDATVQNKGSNWQGALRDIADAQRMGQHSGDAYTLIGLLVQILIEENCERALGELIDQHANDAAFLAAAKRVFDGFGPLPSFRHALYGQVVSGREGIQHLTSLSGNPSKSNVFEAALFGSKMVRTAFDAKLLNAYRYLFAQLPKDPADWEGAEKALKETSRHVKEDHSLANMLNQTLFPMLSSGWEQIGVIQARRNLTDTALRLLDDRRRTGPLPKDLPKYGASSLDPFTGNPLIYRVEGRGFVLYSVGRDRVDDGGSSHDIVVRIH